jgi:hypothetical protein
VKTWHIIVLWLVIGYVLGFYFPTVGNMTIGRLYPRG